MQRDVLDRHPWITQMPMAAPPAGAELRCTSSSAASRRSTAPACGTPTSSGCIGLLSSYTLSEARMAYDAARAAKQAEAAGQPDATAPPPSYEAMLRVLVDEETYPRLYRIAWSPESAEQDDERTEFFFGLDRILDGIQAFIDRTREGGSG